MPPIVFSALYYKFWLARSCLVFADPVAYNGNLMIKWESNCGISGSWPLSIRSAPAEFACTTYKHHSACLLGGNTCILHGYLRLTFLNICVSCIKQ